MTDKATGSAPVIAPLAPLQSSMLAASLAGDGNELYVTQAVFELSASIDHGRWADVWQRLVDRHEALRAIFVTDRQGEPVQVFLESVDLSVEALELSVSQPLEMLLETQRSPRFAFDRAPLLRVALAGRDGVTDLHIMTFHHALLDGWSVELLMTEALALYAGRDLEPSPPFRRYLGWYRGQTATAGEYWKATLTGYQISAPLPGDTADNGDGVQRGVIEHTLDAEDLSRLTAISEANGLTINALLGALWFALAARVTGQEDQVVGMVSAGRDAPVADVQRIAGLVMNAIPVRVCVDADAPALTLADDVQRAVTGAAMHSHLPLRDMARSAGLAVGDAPYDTMLVFEQVPEARAASDEPYIVSRRYLDRSSLPLSVLAFPGSDSLTFRFQFNPSRYSSQMIESLATSYVSGLHEFVQTPQATVRSLEFGAPPLPSTEVCGDIPRVVEQIASNLRSLGENPAVTVGKQRRTWAELHKNVGCVVAALEADGAPAGTPVLLKLQPGADAVAAILGAFFCGRPYVYLDPAYPSAHHDRVAEVVRETFGSRITEISERADGQSQSLVLQEVLRAEPDPLPPTPAHEALAYIVFTSGSTGVPKGVMVSHANLDYSNAARAGVYASAPERFLLLSSLAFDSSVAGLFWTLAHGGELVMPEGSLGESLDRTADLVSAHEITHTLCLPSVYRIMLTSSTASQLDTLRCVIVAGEACDEAIPVLHANSDVTASLHNEYGPSEATVWCSSARLDSNDGEAISIGYAQAGTALYVQSAGRERLADGLTGELVVAGPGVAAGYLGLDADDAFFDGPAGRSYATGDLAVVQAGRVTLLGRRDNQLKVNGVRVELDDVERQILGLAGVRQVAVVDYRAADGRTRLAAHVVTDVHVDSSTLRDAMTDRMPAAHVPARFIDHDELPRLPNGKLDRKALITASVDAATQIQVATGDVNAPATIRALMQEVTGVTVASDTQSFFDLGGDSLAAVNLVDRVNAHFDVSINVADVYESPTAEALGRVVNADAGRDDWLAITPINSKGVTAPLYFAYGNAAILGQHLGDEVPLYWVVHGRHGIVYPTDSFEALAQAHYVQLRKQQPTGPYCLAGFSIGAIIVTELARLLRDAGEKVPVLVLIDPTSPRQFIRRGHAGRLVALLRSSVPTGAALRFCAGRLRDRLSGRSGAPPGADALAGMTLHPGAGISREALVQEVRVRLEAHAFEVCPGGATLIQPVASGVAAAHAEYDRLLWHELFAGTVNDMAFDAGATHTELFADEAAMTTVASRLRAQLDRVDNS